MLGILWRLVGSFDVTFDTIDFVKATETKIVFTISASGGILTGQIPVELYCKVNGTVASSPEGYVEGLGVWSEVSDATNRPGWHLVRFTMINTKPYPATVTAAIVGRDPAFDNIVTGARNSADYEADGVDLVRRSTGGGSLFGISIRTGRNTSDPGYGIKEAATIWVGNATDFEANIFSQGDGTRFGQASLAYAMSFSDVVLGPLEGFSLQVFVGKGTVPNTADYVDVVVDNNANSVCLAAYSWRAYAHVGYGFCGSADYRFDAVMGQGTPSSDASGLASYLTGVKRRLGATLLSLEYEVTNFGGAEATLGVSFASIMDLFGVSSSNVFAGLSGAIGFAVGDTGRAGGRMFFILKDLSPYFPFLAGINATGWWLGPGSHTSNRWDISSPTGGIGTGDYKAAFSWRDMVLKQGETRKLGFIVGVSNQDPSSSAGLPSFVFPPPRPTGVLGSKRPEATQRRFPSGLKASVGRLVASYQAKFGGTQRGLGRSERGLAATAVAAVQSNRLTFSIPMHTDRRLAGTSGAHQTDVFVDSRPLPRTETFYPPTTWTRSPVETPLTPIETPFETPTETSLATESRSPLPSEDATILDIVAQTTSRAVVVPPEDSKGLGGGAIAGIVLSLLVVLAAVGVIAVLWLGSKRVDPEEEGGSEKFTEPPEVSEVGQSPSLDAQIGWEPAFFVPDGM